MQFSFRHYLAHGRGCMNRHIAILLFPPLLYHLKLFQRILTSLIIFILLSRYRNYPVLLVNSVQYIKETSWETYFGRSLSVFACILALGLFFSFSFVFSIILFQFFSFSCSLLFFSLYRFLPYSRSLILILFSRS